MTGKERAKLRAEAHSLTPVFQIGKSGLTDAVIKQTEEVLDAKPYLEKRFTEETKNKTGYLFVTMGAGDNWKLGKALLEN